MLKARITVTIAALGALTLGGSGCADASNVCDGTAQCASGEDEAHCGGGACAAGQLACDDGSCREYYQFCDGVADCAGGEDELCTCAYCEAG